MSVVYNDVDTGMTKAGSILHAFSTHRNYMY